MAEYSREHLHDLSEPVADELVATLEESERVDHVRTCVGFTHNGQTDNARSVRFSFELPTGHTVYAEVHGPPGVGVSV